MTSLSLLGSRSMRENVGGVVRFTMMKDRSSVSVQEGDKRIPWQGAGGVNQRGIPSTAGGLRARARSPVLAQDDNVFLVSVGARHLPPMTIGGMALSANSRFLLVRFARVSE